MGRGPFRGNLSTAEVGLPETGIPSPGSYEFPALNRRLVVEDIEGHIPGPGDVFPTGEYLDSALFSFPFTLRGPKAGDRFHPLGAPGRKKIYDFLNAQKVEKHLRSQTPVLCVDDSILALPGLRIDHRFRVTDKTTHAIRVSWEEMESEGKD
jgi:tRNA(Ile)-lysidine synthase